MNWLDQLIVMGAISDSITRIGEGKGISNYCFWPNEAPMLKCGHSAAYVDEANSHETICLHVPE